MITRALVACSCVALLGTACTASSGSGPKSSAATSPSATATVHVPSTAGAPAASTPVTATPSSSVTPASSSPASSSAASSSPASSSAAGPSACSDKQLTVGHAAPGGATGHAGIVIVFVNESTTGCTLTGYPGAAVLDSSGKQIVQAKRTQRGFLGGCACSPHPVVLRPGGKASALIEGDVAGGDECLRGRALLVTPPDTERSTRVPFEAYSCDVQVHPTVAGAGGGVPR